MSTFLHETAKKGTVQQVQQSFSTGKISVNSCTTTGKTLLLLAAYYGNKNLVKWLLDNNPSKLDEVDDFGQTIFHLAASNGQLELLEWVYMKFSVDVNLETRATEDSFKDTALILASGCGHQEVVRWLTLSVNANVFVRNKNGMTALDMAALNKQAGVVSFLLSIGAGIKASLDDPFFETLDLKNLVVIGATKNKIPIKYLSGGNLIDAISTPDILRRKLREIRLSNVTMIRNNILQNLYMYPNDKELTNAKVILSSLVSLKARCLFYVIDTAYLLKHPIFKAPAIFSEEFRQIIPDNLVSTKSYIKCDLL